MVTTIGYNSGLRIRYSDLFILLRGFLVSLGLLTVSLGLLYLVVLFAFCFDAFVVLIVFMVLLFDFCCFIGTFVVCFGDFV